MLERYSQVRIEAKPCAMESLAVSTRTAGYDTNHDTNAVAKSIRPHKSLGELVDLVGIEPTTSSMPWKRAPSCATGPHCWTLQDIWWLTSTILADCLEIVNAGEFLLEGQVDRAALSSGQSGILMAPSSAIGNEGFHATSHKNPSGSAKYPE